MERYESLTKKLPFWPVRIFQKDNYHFTIEWNDGLVRHYRLSELQKCCPCANCIDEVTGQRRIAGTTIDPNVKATRLVSVGRYALRIDFTAGCSMGLYSYDFLRGFNE